MLISTIRRMLVVLMVYASFGVEAFAQCSENCAAQYGENYEFSLQHESTDGEDTAIEFLVSGGAFEVSAHAPVLHFSGSILSADEDAVVVQYRLHIERAIVVGERSDGSNKTSMMNRRQAGVSSTLRVPLGSPMTIYRVGKERVRLDIRLAR